MFWGSGPCIRSRASAGHLVVYFVTGQMVGDRRSPGATILGVETICIPSQPSLFSPADMSRTSWWIFLPVHRDGFFSVLGLRFALPCGVAASLWPAVAVAAISTKTLRRPCCRLLRQWPTQPSLRSDVTGPAVISAMTFRRS